VAFAIVPGLTGLLQRKRFIREVPVWGVGGKFHG
jgi:hypothetical protein